MSPRRPVAAVAALALVALPLLPGRSAANHAEKVDVVDFEYRPRVVEIGVGKTVTWNWRAGPHTVTSDASGAAAFDSHPNCPPTCGQDGDSFVLAFPKAGVYEYHCKVHGSVMHGTVEVVDDRSSPAPSRSTSARPSDSARPGASTPAPVGTRTAGVTSSPTPATTGSATPDASPTETLVEAPFGDPGPTEPERSSGSGRPVLPVALAGLVALASGGSAVWFFRSARRAR